MPAVRSILLISALLFCAQTSAAQSPPEVADRVLAALSSGAVDSLAELTSDRVQLGVLGAARIYSRSQARYVLEEFAGEHPPASVQWTERMGEEGGWFGIARYRTKTGEEFSVSVLIRYADGEWRIAELIIREAT